MSWEDEQSDIGDELAMTDPYDQFLAAIDGYCDYCEAEGHTFRSCPARDDNFEEEP